MEAIFVIWLLTCMLGSGFFFIYERLSGRTPEEAGNTFNVLAGSAGIGGLIGGLMTAGAFILLMLIETITGLVSIDAIFEFIGTNGLIVFFFSNVSVASAFFGSRGGIR